jgi:hypothetical protein
MYICSKKKKKPVYFLNWLAHMLRRQNEQKPAQQLLIGIAPHQSLLYVNLRQEQTNSNILISTFHFKSIYEPEKSKVLLSHTIIRKKGDIKKRI